MSDLDDYNKETQWVYNRSLRYERLDYFNRNPQQWNLDAFNEMREYLLSDECDWTDMLGKRSDPDLKFVDHLRRYCRTLKNKKFAPDDKSALELIKENRVVLDWDTVSKVRGLLRTSWREGVITYDQAGEIFRIMANKLLQNVFIKPEREMNIVNFSDLESPINDSVRGFRPWIGSSSSSVSSLGKRKCRVCGRPAIEDICYEHIK